MNRRVRPQYDDLDELEPEYASSHEDMEEISFGALNSAQIKIQNEDENKRLRRNNDSDVSEGEEGDFFESDRDRKSVV